MGNLWDGGIVAKTCGGLMESAVAGDVVKNYLCFLTRKN